jgi:urease accessory protein
MLRIVERVASSDPHVAPLGTLTLPFAERCKRRLRTKLDDGREVAIVMPHGPMLRSGDRLRTDDGGIVEICSAHEEVSTARSSDPLLLARACYHLGNRHVALEIAAGRVRYLHDHVLDDMLRKLGLEVVTESSPFEPEAGAYAEAHEHGH